MQEIVQLVPWISGQNYHKFLKKNEKMYIGVEVLNLYINAMLLIFAILEYSSTIVHDLMI